MGTKKKTKARLPQQPWLISDFPMELRRRWKAYCAAKGVTIPQGLEIALKAILEKTGF
jgi:hypothetical protein